MVELEHIDKEAFLNFVVDESAPGYGMFVCIQCFYNYCSNNDIHGRLHFQGKGDYRRTPTVLTGSKHFAEWSSVYS